ncbi:CPBP family intramembrane glutamic endopeptidase [Halorarius halobius]|uniref:CPBP family intramembrane glutamic endopeptidase n=1 Tax=Halorarius halobius TaxID=2962671 RepID=UPI0020CF0EA9|nr:type II CAAX endopeptidase family protein [Halorarius halobius]
MATTDTQLTETLVDDRMQATVTPLADRSWLVLAIAVLPVPLTSAVFIGLAAVGGQQEAYGLPIAYLVYGAANLVTVGTLYALLSTDERSAVFRFGVPSVREVGWAVVAFVVGLGVFQVTSLASAALGYELQGLSYSLGSPTTVAMVVVGAVVLAPLTEEILYRGLVLGVLLSRGVGVVAAVALMTGLFAIIHLPNFGVAGTLFISVWGLLPALVRLRFDNLSGAVLMHALNNTFAYLVVVGMGWA